MPASPATVKRRPGITLRLSDQVRAAANQAAEDDHRSVASLAEMLLIQFLKDRGYLPK
jgi:hypothetical protein